MSLTLCCILKVLIKIKTLETKTVSFFFSVKYMCLFFLFPCPGCLRVLMRNDSKLRRGVATKEPRPFYLIGQGRVSLTYFDQQIHVCARRYTEEEWTVFAFWWHWLITDVMIIVTWKMVPPVSALFIYISIYRSSVMYETLWGRRRLEITSSSYLWTFFFLFPNEVKCLQWNLRTL